MADYDEVVVINQGYELRTSKTGKTRCTVVVRAEPLVYSFSDREIAKGPAQAIAEEMRRKVEDISAPVSEATKEFRKRAAKAFAEGKAWALKRYAGGRMGPMPPGSSDRQFNDSGRFEKSITANWSENDQAWRVNFAANRLNNSDVGVLFDRLVALVPEFGNPADFLDAFTVRRALEESQKKLPHKRQAQSTELSVELIREILEVGREVAETIEVMSEAG